MLKGGVLRFDGVDIYFFAGRSDTFWEMAALKFLSLSFSQTQPSMKPKRIQLRSTLIERRRVFIWREEKKGFSCQKSLKIGQFDPHFRLFNNQYSKYFF